MKSKETAKNISHDAYRIWHVNSGMLVVVKEITTPDRLTISTLCLLKNDHRLSKEELDNLSLFRFIR